ncbi:hypothetical protein BCR44DRAFT_1004518 [Catenaria anguillulae PL171]|uniref:Thioredoxin domain-containing protein n=1 Tax=Catenaria anguillulae PL171 TaxID=765915 RepID=A0A1Y2I3Q9_9FUNG|nr:hypothetical protein BCR44DRAFT_1004518 [Catenaria anguillulae PL171]
MAYCRHSMNPPTMLATIRTALAPRMAAAAAAVTNSAASASGRRFYAAGVTKVSAQEFDQTLKSSKVPVLVDFFATSVTCSATLLANRHQVVNHSFHLLYLFGCM